MENSSFLSSAIMQYALCPFIRSSACLILSVRADALFIFRLSFIYSWLLFCSKSQKEILLACIYMIVVIQFGLKRRKIVI